MKLAMKLVIVTEIYPFLQNKASWLIIDSNETPGGLASTDVTPEGFVSCPKVSTHLYLLTRHISLTAV